MSKIYTKTGDKGKTSLFNGQRVLKSSERVATYGSVDELNSLLGLIISLIPPTKKEWQPIKNELLHIQQDLFSTGASLANPLSEPLERLRMRVLDFEARIDVLTGKLPSLTNFVLPGGSVIAAQMHLARSVSRRVERQIVFLSQTEHVDQEIIVYFNRLSDLLFTFARYANKLEKQKELIWKPSE